PRPCVVGARAAPPGPACAFTGEPLYFSALKLILICDVYLQGRMTKLLGMFRKKREATASAQGRCAACPLASCALGARAAVLRMDCEGSEAFRLRNLGLYEGA